MGTFWQRSFMIRTFWWESSLMTSTFRCQQPWLVTITFGDYHFWWLSPLTTITFGDYHLWWLSWVLKIIRCWVSWPSKYTPMVVIWWWWWWWWWVPWRMRTTEWWLSHGNHPCSPSVMGGNMSISWTLDGHWTDSGWILCVWRVRELVNIDVLWPSSSFPCSLSVTWVHSLDVT